MFLLGISIGVISTLLFQFIYTLFSKVDYVTEEDMQKLIKQTENTLNKVKNLNINKND